VTTASSEILFSRQTKIVSRLPSVIAVNYARRATISVAQCRKSNKTRFIPCIFNTRKSSCYIFHASAGK
jgi:hypothetical protein